MKINIVPRRWWNARPPKAALPLSEGASKFVFFTYTRGKYGYSNAFCTAELLRLQKHQTAKTSPDIIYNFLIGGNGHVYEGRGWGASPKLAAKFQDINKFSVFIAYMGIFKGSMPTDLMVRTGDWLVKLGVNRGYIDPKFLEHRIAHCGFEGYMSGENHLH